MTPEQTRIALIAAEMKLKNIQNCIAQVSVHNPLWTEFWEEAKAAVLKIEKLKDQISEHELTASRAIPVPGNH